MFKFFIIFNKKPIFQYLDSLACISEFDTKYIKLKYQSDFVNESDIVVF